MAGVGIARDLGTFLIWQVRFDQIIVDGKPEVMVISSEDDWLYGCHATPRPLLYSEG